MKSKLEGKRQRTEGKRQFASVFMCAQLSYHLQIPFQKAIRTATAFFVFLLTSFYSIAQGGTDTNIKVQPAEMATTMRSNGKIYVVVAVLIIILTGLFFYLIRLDKKITRLEKGNWKE